eukprot:3494621-Pleurochrysis_carterae.AAC.1
MAWEALMCIAHTMWTLALLTRRATDRSPPGVQQHYARHPRTGKGTKLSAAVTSCAPRRTSSWA